MTNCSAREISDMGVAHVPTERKKIGTVPNMTIRENLILKTYRKPPFSHGMFLNNRAAEENARGAMSEYQIMAPSIDTAVKVLSGGNIQRVVLARIHG